MTDVQSSALFLPEIKDLLARRDYRELKAFLSELNPADLAEGWPRFSPFERILLFKLLSIVRAAELFEEVEPAAQVDLLAALDRGALGPVAESLDAESSGLFHRLPERVTRRLWGLLRRAPPLRSDADRLFAPHTAGALLRTDALALSPKLTAQQALDQVRLASRLHRMGDGTAVYVADEGGRLLGELSARALIAAPRDMRLSQIMAPVQLIKIRADLDATEAARVFAKFKLVAAPVVDDENRLLGVLTADDILSVVNREATEEIARMAGTRAEELDAATPGRVARIRMPWLAATCLAEILVGAIVHRFEATLAQAVALASFMPLIAAMGGNVGTQSSTVCVRGLATGDLDPRDWRRLGFREFRAGLYMGAGYGGLVAVVAWGVFRRQLGGVFPLVVGAGVLISMTVAATLGSIQPFVLHRLKMDPAVAVGPLVSTLTDLMSVSVYLGLATLALSAGWLVP